MLINSSTSTILECRVTKKQLNYFKTTLLGFSANLSITLPMSIAFIKTFSWLSRTRSLVLPSESLDLLAVFTLFIVLKDLSASQLVGAIVLFRPISFMMLGVLAGFGGMSAICIFKHSALSIEGLIPRTL